MWRVPKGWRKTIHFKFQVGRGQELNVGIGHVRVSLKVSPDGIINLKFAPKWTCGTNRNDTAKIVGICIFIPSIHLS